MHFRGNFNGNTERNIYAFLSIFDIVCRLFILFSVGRECESYMILHFSTSCSLCKNLFASRLHIVPYVVLLPALILQSYLHQLISLVLFQPFFDSYYVYFTLFQGDCVSDSYSSYSLNSVKPFKSPHLRK